MQYKKQEISDRILSAGRKEYALKGYRSGNISDIARAAGVPVGNLYRYYDGKMGLLTAIVRPAYVKVPKMLDELFSEANDVARFNATILTQKLFEIYDKYGTDILILADKCASTRYEDFFDKLVEKSDKLLLHSLFKSPTESDLCFCRIISRAFVSSVFDVLRCGSDREQIKSMLERMTVFFFDEIDARIHGGDNE